MNDGCLEGGDGAIAGDVSCRVMIEVLGVSCFAMGLLVFFFDNPIPRPAPSPAMRRATMVTIRIQKMKGLIPQTLRRSDILLSTLGIFSLDYDLSLE